MALPDWLTTHELSEAFGGQIEGLGGRVSECFDDGLHGFAECIAIRADLHIGRKLAARDTIGDGRTILRCRDHAAEGGREHHKLVAAV